MASNQKLFTVGNFDFRLQHLLIIGILALSISISMLIRATPASFGSELFEFDPFFNYRATDFIIDNGTQEYLNWIDDKSWHPYGRNISETSQVTLHITTAILYQLFGFGTSLYNFTILFPLVIGSLTSVVVFAFVRVLGGTTSGLFAALIFSISMPIFSRGLIGWFKSEPLGLFLAFIAAYLFVSGIKNNKGKISILKLIFAGCFLSLGLSAWGGILFFLIAIGLFMFSIPFLKNEKNFMIYAVPVFSFSFFVFSLLFERTSSFTLGFAGIAILVPTVFVVISEIIKKFSEPSKHIRNCSVFLIALVSSSLGIFSLGLITMPTFRYLNAVNPFLTTQDALTDSVAEHMTVQLTFSFGFLSIFMVFTVIGIWALFSKKSSFLKNDMRSFALISGLIGIYISSAFVRLELFASYAIIILASIGLSLLLKQVLQQNGKTLAKFSFVSVIVILFTIPLVLPEERGWTSWADFPPTILNGGSVYTDFTSNDWIDATNWLKENTPKDSIIASWWDYGYWITTLSDRTTLIDNSTLIDWQIKKVAYALTAPPELSWKLLNSSYDEDISDVLGDDIILSFGGSLSESENCEPIFKKDAYEFGLTENTCNPVTKGLDADYILIYLAGERFRYNENFMLHVLEGGGDESKKIWFARIANQQVSKFVQDDGVTPTSYFMENTTLGKLIPFSIVKFVEPNTGQAFDQYRSGFIPVYAKNIKYLDAENDPFYLVYASPSFYSEIPGPMSTVLIYKINPDYTP